MGHVAATEDAKRIRASWCNSNPSYMDECYDTPESIRTVREARAANYVRSICTEIYTISNCFGCPMGGGMEHPPDEKPKRLGNPSLATCDRWYKGVCMLLRDCETERAMERPTILRKP